MILPFCLAGIICGAIAGLVPGLHSNNIAILLAVSPIFGNEAVAFIISMCTTQSIFEFIPSTFIGAAGEGTQEAILPAHRMLFEGKAYEAICHTTLGAIIAIILCTTAGGIVWAILKENSQEIIYATPFILAAALGIFFLGEKGIRGKINSLSVMILASTQGMLFDGQIFPLICGYFGTAGLIYSLKEKNQIPKQKQNAEIENASIVEGIIGTLGGAIVAIMPGIGSNTAAGIINTIRKHSGTKGYLTMLGAINSANFIFSFVTVFALKKARNGGMLALEEKMFTTFQTFILGNSMMLIAGGLGGIATLYLAKKALTLKEEHMKKMTIIVLCLMIGLVGTFNGVQGLYALIFSTALGLYTITAKIKRSTCMSALITPALLYYILILF